MSAEAKGKGVYKKFNLHEYLRTTINEVAAGTAGKCAAELTEEEVYAVSHKAGVAGFWGHVAAMHNLTAFASPEKLYGRW